MRWKATTILQGFDVFLERKGAAHEMRQRCRAGGIFIVYGPAITPARFYIATLRRYVQIGNRWDFHLISF